MATPVRSARARLCIGIGKVRQKIAVNFTSVNLTKPHAHAENIRPWLGHCLDARMHLILRRARIYQYKNHCPKKSKFPENTFMTEPVKNSSTNKSVEAGNALSRRRFLGRAAVGAGATTVLGSAGFLLASGQKAAAQ
jgi:hypothetical protein